MAKARMSIEGWELLDALGVPKELPLTGAVITIAIDHALTVNLTMHGEFDPDTESFETLTEQWCLEKKPSEDPK
jgi:hypothetical protein